MSSLPQEGSRCEKFQKKGGFMFHFSMRRVYHICRVKQALPYKRNEYFIWQNVQHAGCIEQQLLRILKEP